MNFQGESLARDAKDSGASEEMEESDGTQKAMSENSDRIRIEDGAGLTRIAPIEESSFESKNSATAAQPSQTQFPRERLDLRRMRAHAANNTSVQRS